MTVKKIADILSNGDTFDELITEFPSITKEDIFAYLDYAASLIEEQVTLIENIG